MRYQEPLVHLFGRLCLCRKIDDEDTFHPKNITCEDCLADMSVMVLACLNKPHWNSWR